MTSSIGIPRQETPRGLIVPPRAQVVQPQVAAEALAGELVGVGGAARLPVEILIAYLTFQAILERR